MTEDYRLTLTPSQRLALIDIVFAVTRPPLRLQVFVDAARGVETRPEELLALLLQLQPVCDAFRPDANGECLNCDEPASEHRDEPQAAPVDAGIRGERREPKTWTTEPLPIGSTPLYNPRLKKDGPA